MAAIEVDASALKLLSLFLMRRRGSDVNDLERDDE
jgi:hypothetical protein